MKVTAIVKDVTSQFWTGFGESIRGFDNMPAREQLFFCMEKNMPNNITTKVGSYNAFRDVITLNDILRDPRCKITCTKGQRRGYVLLTFDVAR